MDKSFRVNEIFSSIHGEVNGHHQGQTCTFIRLQGCNRNCSYCDSKDTIPKKGGVLMSIHEIISKVSLFGNKYICITGGEPLLHSNLPLLIRPLKNLKYRVSVETNGTIEIVNLKKDVDCFVMDYKERDVKILTNMNLFSLREQDFLKLVVQDERGFEMAVENINYLRKQGVVSKFAISPVFVDGKMTFNISECIRKYPGDYIISIQMHKLLGVR